MRGVVGFIDWYKTNFYDCGKWLLLNIELYYSASLWMHRLGIQVELAGPMVAEGIGYILQNCNPVRLTGY